MAHTTLPRETNPGQNGPRKSHKTAYVIAVVVTIAVVGIGALSLQLLNRQGHVIDPLINGSGTQTSQPVVPTTAPSANQPQPTTAPSATVSVDVNGVPVNLADRLAIFDQHAARGGLTTASTNGEIASVFVANWYKYTNDFPVMYGLTNKYDGPVAAFLGQTITEAFPVNVQNPSAGSGADRTITMDVSIKGLNGYNRTTITVHLKFVDDTHPLVQDILVNGQTISDPR